MAQKFVQTNSDIVSVYVVTNNNLLKWLKKTKFSRLVDPEDQSSLRFSDLVAYGDSAVIGATDESLYYFDDTKTIKWLNPKPIATEPGDRIMGLFTVPLKKQNKLYGFVRHCEPVNGSCVYGDFLYRFKINPSATPALTAMRLGKIVWPDD